MDLEFPDHGLVLLSGKSLETGDGSGTGKTGVFLAIAWALDILPSGFSGSDFVTWGEKDGWVELELEIDGNPVFIRRGKSPRLSFNGQEITSAKAIQESLPKVLKLESELLKALVYREQDERSYFLSLADKDKKEFLAKVIPELNSIESVAIAAGEAVKSKTPFLTTAKVYVENTLQSLASLQSAVVPVDTSELELIKKAVFELEQSESKVLRPVPAQDPKLDALQTALAQMKGELAAHQTNQSLMVANKQQLVRQKAELESKQKKIDSLVANRALLTKNVCHTCKQPWNSNEGAIIQIDAEIEDIQKEMTGIPKIQAEIDLVDTKLSTKPEVQGKIEHLELALSVLKKTQSEAFAQELAQWQKDKSQRDSNLNGLKAKRDSIQALVSKNEIVETQKKALQAKLLKESERQQQLEQEISTEQQIADALGYSGFLGKIFEDILMEIEIEANRFLSGLANAANISVAFETEKTAKNGNTKTSINLFEGRRSQFLLTRLVPVSSFRDYSTSNLPLAL